MLTEFKLQSNYQPSGHQPEAIDQLTNGILLNYENQTLLGVTGSGKTFAFSQLSPEEKARTYILNFDGKAISDDDSEFLKVFHNFDVEDIEMGIK